MRLNTVALTLATAGSLVTAQHHHQHRHHQHKRETVVESGATVVQYELDGKAIPLQEVCAGLADGSLKFANNDHPTGVCDNLSSSSAAPTSTPEVTPTLAPAQFIELSSVVTPASSTSASSSSTVQTPAASSSSASSSSTATGLDADFPDGELDCSTFPSDYGAVALDYLGLGGWSGIQYVSFADKVISEIVTAVTGDACTSGAMCSYACPAGYQKSQWPSTQGSTGQSVGGIECRNGKLYLTNSALSKKLCIPGVGGVHVQNNVGETVAVCRTDYPGTESETIPLGLGDNELQPLTCPDGETYYKWQGKTTSAQYYVNPKGISPEKGCQWGDGSEPIGNWAPINLGVGQNNGKWLSIFQNSPTTTEKLDFNIKIKGDNLSGSCKYENGVFYSETGSSSSGCTVEVMSGDATFVFY
ncbi:SUN family protein UTH1 [Aspergillus thermomutatus]|uniref:Secreted beta-glucosidase sun1 n=1 Tax=Aspergillus thermomutatus TaxID=41047 RepID=A0A397HRY5_ASPTH|nr:Secreted beta-glucosidase sun1 [Aspergillus thermomutatus]RHZ65955.1 Secreted beta-glucosidase sun1 [Aspergillus thermomutatus]